LGGVYGGSNSSMGSGIGYGELFGLGAWEGDVYGFGRHQTTNSIPPQLVSISTSNGAGALVSNSFNFTNGWSGAGVTTKVTINLPLPPPPPK
jgi:hypothetical protein